jgi:hypothetical protein
MSKVSGVDCKLYIEHYAPLYKSPVIVFAERLERLVLDSAMYCTEVTIRKNACKNTLKHHERSVYFNPNPSVDSNPVIENPVISTVRAQANLLKAHTRIKSSF